MITALLSSEKISEEKLRKIVSKKLDLINNVQIYADKKGNIILYPIDFPNSVISLLNALSVSDNFMLLVNSQITALDAELVIAIENSNLKGVIIKDEYSDITSFDRFFKGYKVTGFNKTDITEEHTFESSNQTMNFKYISIDKHFIVKGIGSVIIGFVLGDGITKGEKLLLLPSLKACTIKNIQIMDVDSLKAEKGAHVGLALNNVSEADLSSNYALSSFQEVDQIYPVGLKLSPFYKEDIFSKSLSLSFFGENMQLSLIKDNGIVKAKFNKKIPLIKGRYVIADASLSIGRNRIAGSIEL
jgi:selenocysteine-specific translation elongation factor